MRTFKLKSMVQRTCAMAGIVVAGLAFTTTGHATNSPDYKPAHLIKGYCGSGDITISVNGHHQIVPCSDLDTHNGQGFYHRQACTTKYKKVSRHGHKGYHHKGYHHKGYGHHAKYEPYQHCEWVTHYYQLPVIKIMKKVYKHGHLLSTGDSPEFRFRAMTNGGYTKDFKLKSKQSAYIIAKRDTYTISEKYAHGYKTEIECNGHKRHDYKVNVPISAPGQKVTCIFKNTKKKPVYKKHEYKHDHKKKPVHKKPVHKKHDYKKHAKECGAYGHNLGKARANFAHACPHANVKRRDCDKTKSGNWYCSNQMIGKSAPWLNY